MTDERGLCPDDVFTTHISALIPQLRAFARGLCNNVAMADDLTQEALLKAWNSRASYIPDSNIKAWTFTILRNAFYSDQRRAWRSLPLDMDVAAATLPAIDSASDMLDLLVLRNAIARLPIRQRDAILLVGAGGMSYEEAAITSGAAVGTIKSRVSRARAALDEIMAADGANLVASSPLQANEAFGDLMRQVDLIARRAKATPVVPRTQTATPQEVAAASSRRVSCSRCRL